MVDKHTFVTAADDILDDGKTPTYQAIRERLGGGSFTDLASHYAEWCVMRGYQPRPTKRNAPEHLQNSFGDAVSKIWWEGRRQQSIENQNEADQAALKIKALEEALDDAQAEIASLQRQLNMALSSRSREPTQHVPSNAAENSPASVTTQGTKAPTASVGRRTSTKGFWRLAMQEVSSILDGNRLTPAEIVNKLKKATLHEAMRKNRAFGPGRLADTLRQKPHMFAELKDGRFCRHDQCRPDELRGGGPRGGRLAKLIKRNNPEPHVLTT